MTSRSEHGSKPSSARFGNQIASKGLFGDSSYRCSSKRAPTKPRAPRLLTSILPLVREPRPNLSNENSEPRSWKLKDFSKEESLGPFPPPVPHCSTDASTFSHSTKARASTRHSTRSRSGTPHRLHSPAKGGTRDDSSVSPTFRDAPKIPAYHHSNTDEALADAFSEDYQGQWQWIRGHAKRQGQQLDSESDDCSSWYQSPFSASLPAYPTDSTSTMQPTFPSKTAVHTSPAFQSPVQPVSTASRPLMSSFRVPEHMGSYSASFSNRRHMKALTTTAPPNLQHHKSMDTIDVRAPRQLEFSKMSQAQPLSGFHMPDSGPQLPHDIESKPVDFVSVLQARHEAFCSRELGGDGDIDFSPTTDLFASTRSEYRPLNTPQQEPQEASRQCPQTTGGAKKGRIAAARERLSQSVRVQRAKSADIMMFTNPCATPRCARPPPSPTFTRTEPSPAVPFGTARSHAGPESRSSPQPHTSPYALNACHTDSLQQSPSVGSQLAAPYTVPVHSEHSETCEGHAGHCCNVQLRAHASYAPGDKATDMNGTLELPGPPSHMRRGCSEEEMESCRSERAVLEQEKCLHLHSHPEQGLQRRSSCMELQEGSECLPLEYQVPPMNSSHGGATSPRTGQIIPFSGEAAQDFSSSQPHISSAGSSIPLQDGMASGAVNRESEASFRDTSQSGAVPTVQPQAEHRSVPVDVSLASWERPLPDIERELTPASSEHGTNSHDSSTAPVELQQPEHDAEAQCKDQSCHLVDALQPAVHHGEKATEDSQRDQHTAVPCLQDIPEMQAYAPEPPIVPKMDNFDHTEPSSGLSAAPQATLQSDVHKPQPALLDSDSVQMSANGQSLELDIDSWDTRMVSEGARHTPAGVHNPDPQACECSAPGTSKPSSNRSSSMGGVSYSICSSSNSAHAFEKGPYDPAQGSRAEILVDTSLPALHASRVKQTSRNVVHEAGPTATATAVSVPGDTGSSSRGTKPNHSPHTVGTGELQVSTLGSRILKSAEKIMQQDRRIQVSSIDLSQPPPQAPAPVSNAIVEHPVSHETVPVCKPAETPVAGYLSQELPRTGSVVDLLLLRESKEEAASPGEGSERQAQDFHQILDSTAPSHATRCPRHPHKAASHPEVYEQQWLESPSPQEATTPAESIDAVESCQVRTSEQAHSKAHSQRGACSAAHSSSGTAQGTAYCPGNTAAFCAPSVDMHLPTISSGVSSSLPSDVEIELESDCSSKGDVRSHSCASSFFFAIPPSTSPAALSNQGSGKAVTLHAHGAVGLLSSTVPSQTAGTNTSTSCLGGDSASPPVTSGSHTHTGVFSTGTEAQIWQKANGNRTQDSRRALQTSDVGVSTDCYGTDSTCTGSGRLSGQGCQHPVDGTRGLGILPVHASNNQDDNTAAEPESPVKPGPLRHSLSLWPTPARTTSSPGMPSQRSTSEADRSHCTSSHHRHSHGPHCPQDAAACSQDRAPFSQFEATNSQPRPTSERANSIGVQCRISLELTGATISESPHAVTHSNRRSCLDSTGNARAGPVMVSMAIQTLDEGDVVPRSVNHIAVLRSNEGQECRDTTPGHARAHTAARGMPDRLDDDADVVSSDDTELRAAIQHVNHLLNLRRNRCTSRRRSASTSAIHSAIKCDQDASTSRCGSAAKALGPWDVGAGNRVTVPAAQSPEASERGIGVDRHLIDGKLRSSSEVATWSGGISKRGQKDGFWGRLASLVACGITE